MIYTLREFNDFLDAPSVMGCEDVGLGLMLARLVEKHPATTHSLHWHVEQIRKALSDRRLELYFNANGRWVGSLFWKNIGNLGEATVLAGTDPIDLADMSTDTPWIAYFDVNRVDLNTLLRHAVAVGPLSSLDEIAYARVRQGRRVTKRLRLPAHIRAVPATPSSEADFLANDRGGKQLTEAMEMLSKGRRLGEWARLSSTNPRNSRLNLVKFVNAVTVPLLLGHYLEVRALNGNLEAFLAYGLLTEDGLSRFRRHGSNALCSACFSEGDVITAICASATSSHAVQSALAEQAAALHDGLRRELSGTGVTALDYL